MNTEEPTKSENPVDPIIIEILKLLDGKTNKQAIDILFNTRLLVEKVAIIKLPEANNLATYLKNVDAKCED